MSSRLPDFHSQRECWSRPLGFASYTSRLTNIMKILILLPILATAFFASSCRTITPLDPMTMKQSCKCLPGHFKQDGSCCGHGVSGTK
jgi:hypothetical protein